MSGAPTGAGAAEDPCRPLREQFEVECAQSARLADDARRQADALRQARHERTDLETALRTDLALADRATLWAAKADAQRLYRERLRASRAPGIVQAAAAEWLHEIERLNRAARGAERQAREARGRLGGLEAQVEQLGLRADAARVAAEAGAARCEEWRQRLESCVGVAARWPAGSEAGSPPNPPAGAADAGPAPVPRLGPRSAIVALVDGSRRAAAGLSLRVAEETGIAVSDAQRLLLHLAAELRAAAVREGALVLPAGHPFWSQFAPDDARAVVAALRVLGHGFDGVGGWEGGPADGRQLAMAVAHAGQDPRSVRHLPNGAAMATLWHGTVVDAAAFVSRRAPDLSLRALEAALGGHAVSLAGLDPHWDRIRPILLSDFAATG